MQKRIQITLVDKTGRCKPISTTIDNLDISDYQKNKEQIQKRAILKICAIHHTTWDALRRAGLTTIKVRNYDDKVKFETHLLNAIKYRQRQRESEVFNYE